MLAYVLKSIGDLTLVNAPIPNIEKGWAIVKVKACGICSSDIPRVFKKGTYHFPTIPGHEFSGQVVEIDDDYIQLLNKRVGVFPLIPCFTCEQCKKRNYEMCSNYDYIGSRRDGAFAEYVKVPIWNLIEMPDYVSYEEIAMMEPLSVALHAIKSSNIEKNDSVAVIGTGMIGISAAIFSTETTKDVTIIGRNKEKELLIKNYTSINYIYDKIENDKYDVVIEAVGANQTICQSIDIVKPGGRIIFMGNPSGDITLNQNTYWKILRKQIKIIGTWNSKYDNNNQSDWMDIKKILVNKKIDFSHLITHRFESSKLLDALELMKNHKESYCKVMIIWEET